MAFWLNIISADTFKALLHLEWPKKWSFCHSECKRVKHWIKPQAGTCEKLSCAYRKSHGFSLVAL